MGVNFNMPRLIPIKDFSAPTAVGIQAINNRVMRWLMKILAQPQVNNLIVNGAFTAWTTPALPTQPFSWNAGLIGAHPMKTDISANTRGISGYGLTQTPATVTEYQDFVCHIPSVVTVSGWVLGDHGTLRLTYTYSGATVTKDVTIQANAVDWGFFPGTSTGFTTFKIPRNASSARLSLLCPATSTDITWAEVMVSEGYIGRTYVPNPSDITYVTGPFTINGTCNITDKLTVAKEIDPTCTLYSDLNVASGDITYDVSGRITMWKQRTETGKYYQIDITYAGGTDRISSYTESYPDAATVLGTYTPAYNSAGYCIGIVRS